MRQRAFSYRVLGATAVENCDVWNLIHAMKEAEFRNFGTLYSAGDIELRPRARLCADFPPSRISGPFAKQERTALAKECLEHAAGASLQAIAAPE